MFYSVYDALDDLGLLRMFVQMWHYHQATFRVEEEEDRFAFILDPCGSGGRMYRSDMHKARFQYGIGMPCLTQEPANISFNRKDFPVYCTHCASSNRDQFEGNPFTFVIDGHAMKDPTSPCIQYLYKKAARREVSPEMLAQVGIPDPKRRAKEYPHQLSGGMRQRVMIAMALSTNPELLIADEPTTALDVTIQAQILELMKTLRERNRMAIMLITHDLGVIAEMADDVVVMYAGKVVEAAEVTTIFERPHHPYSQGLLASIPRMGERRTRLEVIQGTVPNPLNLPPGCLFRRRCPHAMPVCNTAPPLQEIGPGHVSRCWLTPAGEPPAIGVEPTSEAAEEAALALSVAR